MAIDACADADETILENWQTTTLSMLKFPAEILVDYVYVYQCTVLRTAWSDCKL